MAYVSIRVEKVKDLKKVHKHNFRLYKNTAPNISKGRNVEDRLIFGTDKTEQELTKKLETVQNRRAIRKDACKLLEVVLSASPEFFYKNLDRSTFDKLTMQDNREQLDKIFNEQLDKEKLAKFEETVKSYCVEKFGDNLINIVCHLDEKTPHFHALVVPLTKDGRLSAKDVFTREFCLNNQNDFAKACKPLGLERGRENSTGVHIHQNEHNAALRQMAAQVSNLPKVKVWGVNKAESLKHPPKIIGVDKEAYTSKSVDKVIEHGELKSREQAEVIAKQNEQIKELSMRAAFHEIAAKNLEELKKTHEATMATLSKWTKFVRDNLRAIPIVKVCDFLKLKYEKTDASRVKLVDFADKVVVNIVANEYANNSTGKTGAGAISFLIDCLHVDYKEATQMLHEGFSPADVAETAITESFLHKQGVASGEVLQAVKQQQKPASTPPPARAENLHKVVDYLVQERGLNPELVKDLVREKRIYADGRANVIITNQSGTMCAARGTYNGSKFKANMGTGEPISFSFDSGKKQQLTTALVFESAIDAFSYRELTREDGVYFVLNGYHSVNAVIGQIKGFTSVKIATDKDQAGSDIAKAFKLENAACVRVEPRLKDFNLDLLAHKQKEHEITLNKGREKERELGL